VRQRHGGTGLGEHQESGDSEQPSATVLAIVMPVPRSLRRLLEGPYTQFVSSVAANARRDLEARYGGALVRFTRLGSAGRQHVILEWECAAGMRVRNEVGELLRKRWDHYCKQGLLGLLQFHAGNTEFKKDIDQIDAYVVAEEAGECYEKGDFRRAADLFRTAISLYPVDSAFYNGLGTCLAKQGSYVEAVRNLKLSLRVDPRNEQAQRNLAAVIKQGIAPNGTQMVVCCPFPECDGTILVRASGSGEGVTSRCLDCEHGEATVRAGEVTELRVYRDMPGPEFPQKLPGGILPAVATADHGIWPFYGDNLVWKPSVKPDVVREHGCVFELELYRMGRGVMPVLRMVLVVLDHPKNPSADASLASIASPGMVDTLRYLKTVSKVNVHVYDRATRYCFSKEVPVAQARLESGGGPPGSYAERLAAERTSWADYVEGLIETGKSMCRSLPSDMLDFEKASTEFASYPVTCVCEVCSREAWTSRSQYRDGGHIEPTKLKTTDAVQCVRCNLVLCMGCAASRALTGGGGRLVSPLSCSSCGQPYAAY